MINKHIAPSVNFIRVYKVFQALFALVVRMAPSSFYEENLAAFSHFINLSARNVQESGIYAEQISLCRGPASRLRT